MRLPYDIHNPPADPPDGVDRLLWKVAYALRTEHEPGPDGFCIASGCRHRSELWPCEPCHLADAGLMGSVGGGTPSRVNERPYAARRS